jgi:hypothetical protein
VRLVETEDKYWAELTNMGVRYVNVPEEIVRFFSDLLNAAFRAMGLE